MTPSEWLAKNDTFPCTYLQAKITPAACVKRQQAKSSEMTPTARFKPQNDYCALYCEQGRKVAKDMGEIVPEKSKDKPRCLEPGCDRAVYCRGLCKAHYQKDWLVRDKKQRSEEKVKKKDEVKKEEAKEEEAYWEPSNENGYYAPGNIEMDCLKIQLNTYLNNDQIAELRERLSALAAAHFRTPEAQALAMIVEGVRR